MIKRSVSVAVFHPRDRSRVVVVQRPADDEDLPNAWGLPAATLRDDESWAAAVVRAGREKLGVDLRVVNEMREGSIERKGYTLEMKLFEALMSGTPSVPQAVEGVTQYQQWQWGSAADLLAAADMGSLCCRLFVEHEASEPKRQDR